MPVGPSSDLTALLRAWREGDDAARARLIELVYGELHRLAHARMRAEAPGHTLQTTALVHEAYLRLADARDIPWHDRSHFFAVCAQTMRRILVDAARARASLKRGGNAGRVPFDESLAVSDPNGDLLALDEALTQLTVSDPRKGKIVELRHFGGLSVEETADVLGLSPQTVMREWKLAKLWLLRALRPSEADRRGEER